MDFSDVMGRHGVSNNYHWQPFFFKSLSMITPQSFVIMANYGENPSAESDSPHKVPVMWKVFPRLDV